jgi:hypothetical protein
VWDDSGNKRVLTPDCLGAGSLIVKTTWDAKSVGGKRYDLDVLDPKSAMRLFCWHAFREQEAPAGLEELVRCAVTAAVDSPLRLRLWAPESGKRRKGSLM